MEENKDTMTPEVETPVPAPAPAKSKKEKRPLKKPTPPPAPKEDGEEDEPKGSKTKKIINIVVNVVLVIAIVMAAISTYISFMSASDIGAPNLFGVALMTVESDSMSPIIEEGDLVVGRAAPKSGERRQNFIASLRPGDIITYRTTIQGNPALNTHTINEVLTDGGNFISFKTKGENNKYVDPVPTHENAVEAKFLFRVPGLGKVVKYIQTKTGFFLVVIIPVLIFFIFHLVQFFKVLFEYQNVKMLIKYEQERGRTEDLIESHIKDQKTRDEMRRAAIEAEVREQLRKEMMEEMARSHQNADPDAAKTENGAPIEEASAETDGSADTTEQ